MSLSKNLAKKENWLSTKGVYKGKSKTDKLLNLGTNIGFGIRKYAYYTLPHGAYKKGKR